MDARIAVSQTEPYVLNVKLDYFAQKVKLPDDYYDDAQRQNAKQLELRPKRLQVLYNYIAFFCQRITSTTSMLSGSQAVES
jgi:hypothetical protein